MRLRFSFFTSTLDRFIDQRPILTYAAIWTSILIATVSAASFAPEMAFLWAINPNSSFSTLCGSGFGPSGSVRVPIDLPGEILCIPPHMLQRTKVDVVVPPIFAATMVAASAFAVRALGLWEVADEFH
ncbi:uncharacterized protein LOC124935338 [Impatiens glandulifera]|uniref:uncharacterized protein LOC124935338 n=1 Tax=Impatiens glandulifera TaxID=253017 RepID=UPI001FB0FAF6|nr:uncharacterized protein LOC124935338 [Impatiens glandulifera]